MENALAQAEAEAVRRAHTILLSRHSSPHTSLLSPCTPQVERRRKSGAKSPQRRTRTFDWSAISTASKGVGAWSGEYSGAGGRTPSVFAERSFEDELRFTSVAPAGKPRPAGAASADADAALLDDILIPAAAPDEPLTTHPGRESHSPSAAPPSSIEELLKESEAAFAQVRVCHAATRALSLSSSLVSVCVCVCVRVCMCG